MNIHNFIIFIKDKFEPAILLKNFNQIIIIIFTNLLTINYNQFFFIYQILIKTSTNMQDPNRSGQYIIYDNNNPYQNTYSNGNNYGNTYGNVSNAPYVSLQIQSKPQDTLAHLEDGLAGQARKKFIMKVYLILTIQLMLTVGMCFVSFYVRPFLQFQYYNQWLMWVLFAFMIITEICIFCLPAGRKHPMNLILLFIFTISQAYVISFICSMVAYQNGGNVVVVAAVMTLAIVLALTVYAIFTPTDFTIKWGIIIVILVAMLMLGIFSLFIWSPFLDNLYCSLGVLVFGIYLVIDTQMIIGGKRLEISMDDYVVGALILYLDIIQIFLYLLEILSKK